MKLSKLMMNTTVVAMMALISLNASAAFDKKAATTGKGGSKCSQNIDPGRHNYTKDAGKEASNKKQKNDRSTAPAFGQG